MASMMSGSAYTGKFADELVKTAQQLVAPGKGILAADESTGTIGKRVGLHQSTAHHLTGLMLVYSVIATVWDVPIGIIQVQINFSV